MNSVQTAVLKKITQTFEIGQILFNYGARKYTEGSTAATLYRDIRKRYENLTTLLRDDDVNMNKVFEEIKDFAEYMKSLAPSAIATDIDGDIKEENERIRRLIISVKNLICDCDPSIITAIESLNAVTANSPLLKRIGDMLELKPNSKKRQRREKDDDD